MLLDTILAFFSNPLHLTVLISSWALALITFLQWRENGKVLWLHAHLAFLLVPLLDFAVAVPCQIPFVQGLLTFCSVVITRTLIFLIPFALLLSVLTGYYIAPALYRRIYRAKPLSGRRYEKLAENAGVRGARFWVLDTAKPLAFSIRKHVLISVGMFELLKRKEQDAVLFHELGHVRRQSSLSRFSVWLARLFSPVAHFASMERCVSADELNADAFAAKMQGTRKHLQTAKRELRNYYSERL
jgi:Zn-dependent protease with chaperone function